MRVRPLLCLLLAIGLSGIPSAQTSAVSVTLDISVTDSSGVPVTGLRAEDLTLRIDNRLQSIETLRLIQHDNQTPPLPEPFATNQLTPGRTITLAVDVTRFQAAQTAALADGIAALLPALGPRDRVSLVPLAIDGRVVDFTSQHDLIINASATLQGVAPVVPGDAKAEEAAAIASLELLERLCLGLASEPGHKTVVFVAPPFDTSSSTRRAMQNVGAVVAQHRITLWVVDPGATTVNVPGGLAALAATTGGVMMPGATSPADTFAAIASRTRTRYEVVFTPSSNQRDGKPHRVHVIGLRADTRITAPSSVFIGDDEARVEAMPALTDMLHESRPYRDLPLRLVAYPVQDADPNRLRLLILGETEEPARTLAWAEFALIAPSGTVVAQWKTTTAEAAIRPLVTVALVPPGPYRLRMAASELSGRRGAVDYEFDAGFTPAAAFSIGPLMFGGMADSAFVPQLQADAGAPAIMGYAEIYGSPSDDETLTARFELLRPASEEPLVSITASVRTTADPNRRAALGTLDLPSLPDTDYLVRAIILLNDEEIGRVTRTLRLASR